MVSVRVCGGVAVLTFLAVGLAAQKDDCKPTKPKACIDDYWDKPVRLFPEKDLKEYHKAFHYADWRGDEDEPCRAFVKPAGVRAFRNAKITDKRTEDTPEPMGGFFFFMWADYAGEGRDIHGAYYPYPKRRDDLSGKVVNFHIIVMNRRLQIKPDSLWMKFQHETAHYAGMGDYEPYGGAYGQEKCAKRKTDKEREDKDDLDGDGGGGGTGGGGGGGGGGGDSPHDQEQDEQEENDEEEDDDPDVDVDIGDLVTEWCKDEDGNIVPCT